MNLPVPFNQQNWKQQIEQADAANQKRNADVVIGKNRLILTDSTGAKWSITVSPSGALAATKL